MRVLIACEESQRVCIAFRDRGHEAYSCDIQPCSGGHPEWHIQGDALIAMRGGFIHLQDGSTVCVDNWDMMIGHPPCTYLSNAGNRYFNIDRFGSKAEKRMIDRLSAAQFFMDMYTANIPRIYLENPVGFINGWLKPTQVVEPYFFGDSEKKKTCLWLKGLPKLIHHRTDNLFGSRTHIEIKPTYVDKSGKSRYFTDSISGTNPEAQKLRSKTFPSIAKAMADQWG